MAIYNGCLRRKINFQMVLLAVCGSWELFFLSEQLFSRLILAIYGRHDCPQIQSVSAPSCEVIINTSMSFSIVTHIKSGNVPEPPGR